MELSTQNLPFVGGRADELESQGDPTLLQVDVRREIKESAESSFPFDCAPMEIMLSHMLY